MHAYCILCKYMFQVYLKRFDFNRHIIIIKKLTKLPYFSASQRNLDQNHGDQPGDRGLLPVLCGGPQRQGDLPALRPAQAQRVGGRLGRAGGGGGGVPAPPPRGRGHLRHLAPVCLEPARYHPSGGYSEIQVSTDCLHIFIE